MVDIVTAISVLASYFDDIFTVFFALLRSYFVRSRRMTSLFKPAITCLPRVYARIFIFNSPLTLMSFKARRRSYKCITIVSTLSASLFH